MYFRPCSLLVIFRTRYLETYLIFCNFHVCLNILHLCTDTVKEAKFTAKSGLISLIKMITVTWTFRKELTCAAEVKECLSRRCGNSETMFAVYQPHYWTLLCLSAHRVDKCSLFPSDCLTD